MGSTEPLPDPRLLRPAFVWLLLLVAGPILLLFGVSIGTDAHGSATVLAPTAYWTGMILPSLVLISGRSQRGTAIANALVGAIASASLVLFLDLVAFGVAGSGSTWGGLCWAVTALAVGLAWIVGHAGKPVPPRPDIQP